MNDKDNNNQFRFSLFQENVLLVEKVFDADVFNPITRYSIDIRDILPKAITKIQKTLSKRNYVTSVGVGLSNPKDENSEVVYELYNYVQKMISLYEKEYRKEMYYNPTSITQQIETKTIRGVECKIGLYINDKPIVERIFYVDNFNPVARWSADLTYVVTEITDNIFEKIKKTDVKNMWDDYDLINLKGLTINQIRELSPIKRSEMLRWLRKN